MTGSLINNVLIISLPIFAAVVLTPILTKLFYKFFYNSSNKRKLNENIKKKIIKAMTNEKQRQTIEKYMALEMILLMILWIGSIILAFIIARETRLLENWNENTLVNGIQALLFTLVYISAVAPWSYVSTFLTKIMFKLRNPQIDPVILNYWTTGMTVKESPYNLKNMGLGLDMLEHNRAIWRKVLKIFIGLLIAFIVSLFL